MPLESCMILLDNSEYMRNSDYVPTRLEAQHDAANFLVGAKTRSNPESTVGVIAMCGHAHDGSGELLVSPTDDVGKVLTALHGVPLRPGVGGCAGGADVVVSLQVANLALKHRRNKNGAQRVVIFVGSPLDHVDARALAKAGRALKKNNLAVDVVALGESEANSAKLRGLVDAANGGGGEGGERTCHLVEIPAGALPSDVLVSSPVVSGGGGGGGVGDGGTETDAAGAGAGAGGGGGGGFADYGGVDPNMDPELAMALRVSMEEERARQERAAVSTEDAGADAAATAVGTDDGAAVPAADEAPTAADGDAEPSFAEEDALLRRALAMSMENEPTVDAGDDGVEVRIAEPAERPADDVDEDDEDAAMQLALRMSMQTDEEEAPPAAPAADTATEGADAAARTQFQDPQFVNQLLGSLPGVDANNPELNDTIRNLLDKKDGDDKKDDDEPKK